MAVREIGDPRLQALFGAGPAVGAGVRPTVRLSSKGVPPFVLAIVALLLGIVLFATLNARRTAQVEPAVRERAADVQASGWQAPPPLYIPPALPQRQALVVVDQRPAPQVSTAAAPASIARSAPAHVIAAPQPLPQPMPTAPPAPPIRVSSGSPLVIDSGPVTPSGGSAAAATAPPVAPGTQSNSRIKAGAFANRSTTVPQGHLIPAVLETGFDSTKPGYARAIVSRDVRSFDGKNILIPRGSRLIGEYQSTVAHGQSRAMINWTRLIRPDGMTIAIGSPTIDTLGRGGVAARVNTHFFARLGDAILQSTIGLGSTLAQRSVTGPVVLVPGATTAAAAQMAPPINYAPTLTVPPGKSISVFVAHDLDFSAAGEFK